MSRTPIGPNKQISPNKQITPMKQCTPAAPVPVEQETT
jgi:hypothetical protein